MNKSYFKSLIYKGVYDRQGRKVQLIEAATSKNYSVAMAFDLETKRLVSYATSAMELSFDDYRKTAELFLPYSISRQNLMNIKIDEIKLNEKIEDKEFSKKENCFDKAN